MELSMVNEENLSRLRHLDISGKVVFISNNPKCHGGFSEVFKGQCIAPERGKVEVAIKRLRFLSGSSDRKKLFEAEIYVWSKLHHPHVQPLLGYAFCARTGYPLLVSEWMPYGSAWCYLEEHPETSMSEIADLVADIAAGMEYLHANGVIHSDLKADNVLISSGRRALIADFGCSRMFFASRSLAKVTATTKGTVLFWAPELLDIDNDEIPVPQTKATDVWAFGMTVYELMCRRHPYGKLNQLQVILAIIGGRLPAFTCPREQSDSSDDGIVRARLERICISCWNPDPAERPSMDALSNRHLVIEEDDQGGNPRTRTSRV